MAIVAINPMSGGRREEIIKDDDNIHLNGKLEFELKASTYSDEIEISSYIENIFKSIEKCLIGFNTLIRSANNYLEINNEISNIELPSLTEVSFSIDSSGLKQDITPVISVNNAVVNTKGGSLNVRNGMGVEYNKVGSIENQKSVSVLEKGDKWTKISYTDQNEKEIEGYVSSDFLNFQ